MIAQLLKKVVVVLFSVSVAFPCLGQTDAWYIGAFSAADGSKLLVTESRVYAWTAQGEGCIIGDFSQKDVYWEAWESDYGPIAGQISIHNGPPLPVGEGGTVEFLLTANKTILDYDKVAYKKNPGLLLSLRDEAGKLDQERGLAARAYTDFIYANKWLQGVWMYESRIIDTGELLRHYLIIFPQGMFYVDEDEEVWQLEARVDNDSTGTAFLGDGWFKIDMSAQRVEYSDGGGEFEKILL